jgi:hypothetical protein
MAKRITEFTSATVLAETDVLPVVDLSDTTQATSGTTKKSALSLIADYLKARVETLTNKTLTSPKINEDVEVTATSTELNKLDGVAGDVVGTTDTQTLTNKTIDGDSNTVQDVPYSAIKGVAWTSFTPTWTHFTPGNSTVSGHYCQIGKVVFLTVGVVLGSTASVAAAEVKLTLPVTGKETGTGFIGNCMYVDMGTASYGGNIQSSGTLIYHGSPLGYVATEAPFAWAEGDIVKINATYEAA